jgi:hypothetical protein
VRIDRRSPAKQVAGFIARFEPSLARLVRAARAALRKRFPTAIELVYDNYNALAIGFASTERMSDIVVSLAVYPRGMSLYFLYGARLPDPNGLLEGSGNKGRFVRLPDVALLKAPPVQALLRAAVARANTPFASTGRGCTVVRSASRKQRPRRSPPPKKLLPRRPRRSKR